MSGINVGHVLKPPTPGICGSLPTWRNSLRLGLGTGTGVGRPRPVECPRSRYQVSPSRRALNSLPLVSSDALTPLICYICELRKRIEQSQDWLCNLEIGAEFSDSEYAQIRIFCRTYTHTDSPLDHHLEAHLSYSPPITSFHNQQLPRC